MSAMGDRIRQKRQEFGWSQSELARRMVRAGFPKQTQMYITRSENGARPIPVDEALALADVLNVSIQWLATGRGDHRAEDRYLHGYRDGIYAARKAIDGIRP
jgi:transcriptional regulator with XRE-family HTH domain